MKFGNENGEDCETSMFSPPANMVTSLVGWSLNDEIVEFDRDAPVLLELRRDLAVDVAIGPDDEVEPIDLALRLGRPGPVGREPEPRQAEPAEPRKRRGARRGAKEAASRPIPMLLRMVFHRHLVMCLLVARRAPVPNPGS